MYSDQLTQREELMLARRAITHHITIVTLANWAMLNKAKDSDEMRKRQE